jgi:hypothetical protein
VVPCVDSCLIVSSSLGALLNVRLAHIWMSFHDRAFFKKSIFFFFFAFPPLNQPKINPKMNPIRKATKKSNLNNSLITVQKRKAANMGNDTPSPGTKFRKSR